MKLFGKILVGFVLIILVIILGVSIYIDIPVFKTQNEFEEFMNNYNYVENDEKLENMLLQSQDIIKENVVAINSRDNEVVVAYYVFAESSNISGIINNYLKKITGNIKKNAVEISIPFYGKYWSQESKGITNIGWLNNNKVIIIKSDSSSLAKMIENDVKAYLK